MSSPHGSIRSSRGEEDSVAHMDITSLARPYLRELAARTRQTSNLGILDRQDVVHLCVEEPDRQLRFRSKTGSRDTVYSTALGKILLAHIEPDRLAEHLPPEPFPAATSNTRTNRIALERDLRTALRMGFASETGEGDTGVGCLAIPVFDGGQCIAAISISGPLGEVNRETRNSLLEDLRLTSASISLDHELIMAIVSQLRGETR